MEISRVPSWSTHKILSTYRPYVNKTPTISVGFNEILAGSPAKKATLGASDPPRGWPFVPSRPRDARLAEEVPLGLHEQIPTGPWRWVICVATHDGDRYPRGLAHHQLCGGGKLVGHR